MNDAIRGISRSGRRLCLWVMIGGLLGIHSVMAASPEKPTLQLLTEEYPPLTYSDRGRPAGLVTEIVREMVQRSGYQATIEVVPWARGYAAASKTPNVGLFSTSRIAEREGVFKWVGPLASARSYLYARRSSQNPPRTLDDARTAKNIAVPREWYLHQILRKERFENLYLVPDPGTALRMLAGGRVELAALDEVTFNESAIKEGVAVESIRPTAPMVEVRQYLVFSRDTDDAIVRDLQQAYDSMRSDGTVARLYRQWLPGILPPDAQ